MLLEGGVLYGFTGDFILDSVNLAFRAEKHSRQNIFELTKYQTTKLTKKLIKKLTTKLNNYN